MLDLTVALPIVVLGLFLARACVLWPLEIFFWRRARSDEPGDNYDIYLSSEYKRRFIGPYMLNIFAVIAVLFVTSFVRGFDPCVVGGVNACVIDPSFSAVTHVIVTGIGALMVAVLMVAITYIGYSTYRDILSLRVAYGEFTLYIDRMRQAEDRAGSHETIP